MRTRDGVYREKALSPPPPPPKHPSQGASVGSVCPARHPPQDPALATAVAGPAVLPGTVQGPAHPGVFESRGAKQPVLTWLELGAL